MTLIKLIYADKKKLFPPILNSQLSILAPLEFKRPR